MCNSREKKSTTAVNDREMQDKAQDARRLSHASFSGFSVGAALLCKDGTVIQGANVENITLALTVCAERNALFSALMQGYKPGDFSAIWVAGPDRAGSLSPCGPCRQLLAEYCGLDLVVHYKWGGIWIAKTLRELLPDFPEVSF